MSQAITVGGQEGELLAYLDKFKVSDSMEEMLTDVVRSQPADPFPAMADWLVTHRVSKSVGIDRLVGREVLDGAGVPSVEVDCYVNVRGVAKLYGRGVAPNSVTRGPSEPQRMSDGDETRFQGQGVQNAVAFVNSTLSAAVSGVNPVDQPKVDECLSNANGSADASNATIAASFAISEAAAKVKDIELYEYFAFLFKGELPSSYVLPLPLVNVLSGWKHSIGARPDGRSPLRFQEFWIIPSPKNDDATVSFATQVKIVSDVYNKLGEIIQAKFPAGGRAPSQQGAYTAPYTNANDALTAIEEAITGAGYEVGVDVNLGMDVGAQELWNEEAQKYEVADDPKSKTGAGEMVDTEGMINYLSTLITNHPAIVAVEDPVRAEDEEGWKSFTEKFGDKILVIGDDLFSPDLQSIKSKIEDKHANSMLLKPDSFGTVNKAVNAAQMLMEASESKSELIVSHRSGETSSTLLVDMAVGLGAGYIKMGGLRGSEHVAKFNRLLQIEESITM